MDKEKFLPIGSVVLLKNAKKRIMITGFLGTRAEEPGVAYDYCGCLYPEGFLSSNQVLLFNHCQIDKIFAIGFSDDEEKNFKLNLKDMESKLGI